MQQEREQAYSWEQGGVGGAGGGVGGEMWRSVRALASHCCSSSLIPGPPRTGFSGFVLCAAALTLVALSIFSENRTVKAFGVSFVYINKSRQF